MRYRQSHRDRCPIQRGHQAQASHREKNQSILFWNGEVAFTPNALFIDDSIFVVALVPILCGWILHFSDFHPLSQKRISDRGRVDDLGVNGCDEFVFFSCSLAWLLIWCVYSSGFKIVISSAWSLAWRRCDRSKPLTYFEVRSRLFGPMRTTRLTCSGAE